MSLFNKKDKHPADQSSPKPTEDLHQGLGRTRSRLGQGLSRLILGKKQIGAALFKEIEAVLLSADVGVSATQDIIDSLTADLSRKALSNNPLLMSHLKTHLINMLEPVAKPLVIPQGQDKPFMVLVVGVNGAGKTTAIGKLAYFFQSQGKSVLLAAGDTFRAAAIEQLKAWGERSQIPVIAQTPESDSAAVIFDALQSATAQKTDLLISDTAGRLHNKDHLMDELKKVVRVVKKIDETAPHEILLVLDASIGQNALAQAKTFHQALGVTGLAITKLDGTAKGGILFAIAKELALPVRFIGVGESIEDLKPFNPQAFVEALFE
jgi:fused signal recognition particle receptor